MTAMTSTRLRDDVASSLVRVDAACLEAIGPDGGMSRQ